MGSISYSGFKTCYEDKFIYFVQAFVWCSSLGDTSDSDVLSLLQHCKSLHLPSTDDKRCALRLQLESYRYTKSQTSGTWAGIVDTTIHYSVDSKQLSSDFRSRCGCSTLLINQSVGSYGQHAEAGEYTHDMKNLLTLLNISGRDKTTVLFFRLLSNFSPIYFLSCSLWFIYYMPSNCKKWAVFHCTSLCISRQV